MLKVLVTRPAHQAAMLCQLIEQQGGKAIALPTIAIENSKAENNLQLTSALSNLAQQDIAIFISPNAVLATAEVLQHAAINWPMHLMVAAIGASTADALTALGLPVSLIPAKQFNSEGLLALPALQKIKGKRIILFRGEGGRELLSTTLQARGASLTEAIVYRRALPVINNLNEQLLVWQNDGLDIIVCTSNTGLQNLVTMIGPVARQWLLNMPLLVISERMAVFAATLGFVKPPLVADNATDDAIVKALLKFCDL